MDELQQVYLIHTFPDHDSLRRAIDAIRVPPQHLAILGSQQSGAQRLADELGLATTLNSDVELDDGQSERLHWHLQNSDRPMLATQVAAEQGREVRLQITEVGGEPITETQPNVQANDLVVDPGIEQEEPPLPPGHGNLSDKHRIGVSNAEPTDS